MIYNPIFDISDIPSPPLKKKDLVKLTLIQIDECLSETTIDFRSGIRVAATVLDEENYQIFLDGVGRLGKEYENVRNNIQNLSYIIPESPKSEGIYRTAKNIEELKEFYVKDCRNLNSSLNTLFSECAGVFQEFQIKYSADKFSDNKKIITKGVNYLAKKGLEDLLSNLG